MHDDVTRPKDSMVVVVTLKSKMVASSASRGGIVKFIFPPSGKYNTILDSCMTEATTM